VLPDRPGDQLDIMHATRECSAFDDPLVVVQPDFKLDHHHPFVRSRITQKLLFVVSQPFADSRLDVGLMDFCA
jgi:hypothetical protein